MTVFQEKSIDTGASQPKKPARKKKPAKPFVADFVVSVKPPPVRPALPESFYKISDETRKAVKALREQAAKEKQQAASPKPDETAAPTTLAAKYVKQRLASAGSTASSKSKVPVPTSRLPGTTICPRGRPDSVKLGADLAESFLSSNKRKSTSPPQRTKSPSTPRVLQRSGYVASGVSLQHTSSSPPSMPPAYSPTRDRFGGASPLPLSVSALQMSSHADFSDSDEDDEGDASDSTSGDDGGVTEAVEYRGRHDRSKSPQQRKKTTHIDSGRGDWLASQAIHPGRARMKA